MVKPIRVSGATIRYTSSPFSGVFSVEQARFLEEEFRQIEHAFLGVANDTFNYKSKVDIGATADRPSSPYTGQTYFDTTISKPIWYDGTNWVDATGTTS
jgi:hypothetical protein